MKIAVIGSGPSGLATILGLLEKSQANDQIVLVHGNFRWSNKTAVKNSRKHKFGSHYMFANGSLCKESEGLVNLSLANGGLSSIWGAGLRLWDQGDIAKLGITPRNVYESARTLLEYIPYTGGNADINLPLEWKINSNSNIKSANSFENLHTNRFFDSKCEVVRPSLAIHTLGQKSCQDCGLCLSGCPYGSIFDSGELIDLLIVDQRIKSISGIVRKILPTDAGIELTIDEGKHFIHEEFDEIYLCAGAIGTPLLLINSELVSKNLFIKDSQVFNLIGLRIPQKKLKESFPLGQAIIKSKDKSHVSFSITLFQLNKKLISNLFSRISPKLRFLLNPIGYLSKFVFVGIGFLDSNDSNELLINRDDKTITFNQSHSKFNQNCRVFRIMLQCNRTIMRKGFFFLPFAQRISKPGYGYHSGGALSIGSELVDDSGRLRANAKIHISDTSLLRFIKPGAHTFMAMSLIHSICRK